MTSIVEIHIEPFFPLVFALSKKAAPCIFQPCLSAFKISCLVPDSSKLMQTCIEFYSDSLYFGSQNSKRVASIEGTSIN